MCITLFMNGTVQRLYFNFANFANFKLLVQNYFSENFAQRSSGVALIIEQHACSQNYFNESSKKQLFVNKLDPVYSSTVACLRLRLCGWSLKARLHFTFSTVKSNLGWKSQDSWYSRVCVCMFQSDVIVSTPLLRVGAGTLHQPVVPRVTVVVSPKGTHFLVA